MHAPFPSQTDPPGRPGRTHGVPAAAKSTGVQIGAPELQSICAVVTQSFGGVHVAPATHGTHVPDESHTASVPHIPHDPPHASSPHARPTQFGAHTH